MTRVFFWSADSSGCSYYRCELPAAALTARGHETLVATRMPDEWCDADVIVGQRVCQPGPTQRWQELAKEGRSALVYEVDDDLLDIDPSNKPAWAFFGRPDIQANVIRNASAADLVTVTTEHLAEVMRRYNKNVAVLPNCVPASLLDAPPGPGRKGVVIGWAGGASHSLDLAELGGNLQRFVRRYPEVSLHLMGDAYAASLLAKGVKDRARYTPWVESVPDFHAAIDFDIALAPLRPSPFNRSKSAIRCLEAAALGIPIIASDFGPYAEFVQHGSTGFLCKFDYHWLGSLRELLDPFLRQKMGKASREQAAEYTIEKQAHLWEAALCN